MASALTHGFVGLVATALYASRPVPRRLYVLAAACAILPDADVIAFPLGIPYSHLLGHRGLSHSIAFALVTGMLVTWLAFRDLRAGSKAWWGRSLFLAAVTASHGVLDALTNGGLGVAFFAPLSDKRHFLPWRPIVVSPVNVRHFAGTWAKRVLVSEVKWVWIPALALLAIVVLARRARAR
jgi:inner membrane protein